MNKTIFLVLILFAFSQFAIGQDVPDWVVDLHKPDTYNKMPYRLMDPISFNANKSYPVIVSLHGGGGRGTDNLKQLRNWNTILAEEQNRKDYPCYVLAPQANELWNGAHLSNIKAIIKDLPSVDMDRIYILGHSMGGHGTYIITQIDPDYFAAAAPSAGSGLKDTEDFIDVSKIKDIPFWAFHGDSDKVCPIGKDQKVFAEMKEIGGNMKFTIWKGEGHGIPVKNYTENTKGNTQFSSEKCDPEPVLLKWLFKQKK